jgi:hypothetical protein
MLDPSDLAIMVDWELGTGPGQTIFLNVSWQTQDGQRQRSPHLMLPPQMGRKFVEHLQQIAADAEARTDSVPKPSASA